MEMNIAIFFSGNGSNMLNIKEAIDEKKIKANIKIFLCNNPKAKGIKKLCNNNKKLKVIDHKKFASFREWELEVEKYMQKLNVDLICLAGFMKILSEVFVKKWKKKIINIHPSLLPAFKGLNAQKRAFEYGVKFTGCTVHYVNEELDGGDIIEQSVVKIAKNDTLNSLTKKILIEEHKIYINVLKKLSNGKKLWRN
tara:strand:+ start:155 stop:742 length:588 start_codon:yes stop_codon:yes gene_type:complete